MSFRFPGILLFAFGIVWIGAGDVFAMDAVYLRGKLLTEKKKSYFRKSQKSRIGCRTK